MKRVIPRVRSWVRSGLSLAARRLEETSDVVQDILFNAHQRLLRFENRGRRSYSAFLYRATENRLKNLRQRSARVEAVEVAGDVPVRLPELSTTDLADRTVAVDQFWKAFRSAKLADQEALCAWLRQLSADPAGSRDGPQLDASAPAIWQRIAQDLGKRTPDAARVAVRRASERILRRMS